MNILIRQFLGKRHSWSFIGHGLAIALLAQGHKVDLYSTDGIEHLPTALKPHLLGYAIENTKQLVGKRPSGEYDIQMSYTAPHNWQRYLSNGTKNRFACWTYEWSGLNALPNGFAKQYKHCDLILAPSQFSRQIFLNSGVPDTSIKVIPHGIDPQLFASNAKIDLGTTKAFKILANIAQPHIRKNIPSLLEAYGKAFTNKDDVCLILKAKPKKPSQTFDVDLNALLRDFNVKFSHHADLKVYGDYVENIATIYNSIDAVYTMTHCEGFYMPALEGLAAGKINIAPNYGGQKDFLNHDNSLLIDGKEERANPKSMYWEQKSNALWFNPSIDSAVDKLRYAYANFQSLNEKLAANKLVIQQQYSWDTIAERITSLCQ
jgi:glycosyltransferase involved in cell wall biosynthesis